MCKNLELFHINRINYRLYFCVQYRKIPNWFLQNKFCLQYAEAILRIRWLGMLFYFPVYLEIYQLILSCVTFSMLKNLRVEKENAWTGMSPNLMSPFMEDQQSCQLLRTTHDFCLSTGELCSALPDNSNKWLYGDQELLAPVVLEKDRRNLKVLTEIWEMLIINKGAWASSYKSDKWSRCSRAPGGLYRC